MNQYFEEENKQKIFIVENIKQKEQEKLFFNGVERADIVKYSIPSKVIYCYFNFEKI